MKRARRTELRGFTLLEMLLALGLSAVVLSAIYSLLFAGAKDWRRVRQRAEIFQAGRATLEIMRSDLQNALLLSKGRFEGRFPFKGDSVSVSFPATLSTIDPQAAQAPFERASIGVVSYAWRASAQAQVPSLERDWTLLVPEDSPSYATSGKDVFPVLISSVTFSYPYENSNGAYPPIVWSSRWEEPERVPGAVRIVLVVKQPDSGEQVTFSRTISIPQGELGDSKWVADAKP